MSSASDITTRKKCTSPGLVSDDQQQCSMHERLSLLSQYYSSKFYT